MHGRDLDEGFSCAFTRTLLTECPPDRHQRKKFTETWAIWRRIVDHAGVYGPPESAVFVFIEAAQRKNLD